MNFLRRFGDVGIRGVLARWYDGNVRARRLEEMRGYAREVVQRLPQGGTVLEVAPGPGYLSIELAKMGPYRVTGLDISEDFVAIASRNAREAGVPVKFVQGSVAQIPLDSNTVDMVICTAAFKNFQEPLAALNEMHRVLRPEASALIVDMNHSVSNQKLDEYVRTEMKMEGMDAVFIKLMFKYFLRRGAYTKQGIEQLVAESSFRKGSVLEEGIGLKVELRK